MEEKNLKEFTTKVNLNEYAIFYIGENHEVTILVQRVEKMPDYETPEGIPVMRVVTSNANSMINHYGFFPDQNLIEVIGETTESAAKLAYTVSCGTC